MDIVERIADRRIREAMERGEFDNLPGAGRPLALDDDSNVPPELRVAYRILKRSGFVPPEVELRRDIASAEQLLVSALTPAARSEAHRRLDFLLMKLAAMRGGSRDVRVESDYYDRLAAKVRHRSTSEKATEK
jgi:hypothetical protein